MQIDMMITGGDVYTPERIISPGMVAIAGGRIVACEKMERVDKVPCIDATGKIVARGFVDIHIHGGGGGDFIDGNEEAIRRVLQHHASRGTTALVATTSTAPMPKIFKAFDAIAGLMGHEEAGAEILGIHMEGPYFAKPEPGCHVAELIHDPTDPEEIARVLSYARHLKRVTLAPEINGALALIRELAQRDVTISGGHSAATYREVRLGREAGMTHLTHHWSAMSGVRRVEAKRFSGMVEAGLVCDDLTTEVIADGRHLPTSLLRLAYKCKGAGKLCLISDSMRAAGLPEGVYEVCEMQAVVVDGVALTMDRTCFASSIITVDQAVRHMVMSAGISLADALRMASLTPAEVIGIQHRKGSLAVGKDADILILNRENLTVEQVFRRGQRIAASGVLVPSATQGRTPRAS
jgi:N-acetylglucosamine-6-phosphate deacetylase